MFSMSPLQKLRLQYQPKLPKVLQDIRNLIAIPKTNHVDQESEIVSSVAALFPQTRGQPQSLVFVPEKNVKQNPKRVGVVLSGGQAPGGHNVISGLFDALKTLNPNSKLYGFLGGPSGIVGNCHVEITGELLANYRNQGGFDLIGSGRTKIETPEQFAAAKETAKSMDLDGIVIIGGDDSNTNAAFLAEYFCQQQCKTAVVGVPKTIDGDLKNEDIEISFGFDTASKTYSEIIGNIQRDALSAKKYYYFIKLMGRSASHITLECALQTHPNMALISEEIAAQRKTLLEITHDICNMICERHAQGKDYGVILIPEGIIEFIPEFKQLIEELNSLLSEDNLHSAKMELLGSSDAKISYIAGQLSSASAACFQVIPVEIQVQLLLDRDPHGNVQVSRIETERLFIEMVRKELNNRKKAGAYSGKFSGQPHFCGYEGRSCFPTNFDAQYCYSLGYVAALLINNGSTGYISCVQKLALPIAKWQVAGKSLLTMMAMEQRQGKPKPVIKKALVELNGAPFLAFIAKREEWMYKDDYCYPGPVQFFGPEELTESSTQTLILEHTGSVSYVG